MSDYVPLGSSMENLGPYRGSWNSESRERLCHDWVDPLYRGLGVDTNYVLSMSPHIAQAHLPSHS